MCNTYRFATVVWQLQSKDAGKCWKICFVNKNRCRQKNQKVPLIFFQMTPARISVAPVWVFYHWSEKEGFEKIFEALFVFFDAENHDFCTTGGSINHLLKQGNFWNYAINPNFLHDFTTYSTDKHNFDQRFKFVHQMRVLRKVCLWDSNDHYTWHLVLGRLQIVWAKPIMAPFDSIIDWI